MIRQNPFAALMSMTDRTWARHANPWSFWTRVPLLALFSLVIHLRGPLGHWTRAALAALAIWTVLNPRAFPQPASTDHWTSKATFGERVWLNRQTIPIPAHHERWAIVLSTASALCLLPLAWGLWILDPWATAFGAISASILKLWFVDRMVWLYEDMKDASPEYRGWLR